MVVDPIMVEMCGSSFLIKHDQGSLFGSDREIIEKYWHPQKSGIYLDVGFGPGTWTLAALACGARTLSFDPSPAAFKILTETIMLNGFRDALVSTMGLWHYNGRHPFSGNSLVKGDLGAGEVPVATLDDFMMFVRLPYINAINMDVEWAEREVILGARKTIRNCWPDVIIDLHDDKYQGEIEVELKKLGPYSFKRDAGFMIASTVPIP